MDSKVQAERAQAEIERDLGFLVHDVARLLRRGFDRRVRRLGITRAQWFVVAYLHRKDGQRLTDLADELDLGIAPLGKLLDRLEAGGWVTRSTDPGDRRVTRVHKTGKMNEFLAEMRSEAQSLYESTMIGMSVNEKRAFVDLLVRARANLLKDDA